MGASPRRADGTLGSAHARNYQLVINEDVGKSRP